MNNATLAKRFIEGREIGMGSNMFIEGHTIYSYGYHFPIAELVGTSHALFNSNGYSNTTARHKSHVYSALVNAGKIIIECPQCDMSKAREYIQSEIDKSADKVRRARKPYMVEYWINRLGDYKLMMSRYEKLSSI